MCDLWQDEEGIIQSEEEKAEEMSSYESEDNQDQVSNKTSTLKINAKINDVSTVSRHSRVRRLELLSHFFVMLAIINQFLLT